MQPRFSVVVPTCDRANLLHHTLRALLAIDRDDIEIVVSDNASKDDTQAVISEFKSDKRLVAARADNRMSMPDHWNFASSHSSGEWIIVNGDDDGLSPSIFNYLSAAIGTLKPRLLSWHSGLYHHPDYKVEGTPNTLYLTAGHSRLAAVLDPRCIIERYAGFDFDYFPEGTRFCVARELAAAVIKRTGRFFWPTCPDFSAPLLCLCEISSGDYVYLDAALSFGGRSAQSNAAAFLTGGDKARVESYFNEFQKTDVYPFHEPKLPFYYNGHAAALSLATQFYSLPGIEIDQAFLYRTMFEESKGIRYNPLITQTVVGELERYIEGIEFSQRKIIDEVRRDVDKRIGSDHSDNKLEKLRNSITQELRKKIKGLLLRRYANQFRTRPHKIELRGFENGFDLSSRWDEVLEVEDPFTTERIDKMIETGLLLSAHNLSKAMSA